MVNAATLKVEAMAWLRFGRQLELVATEAGNWNADVLGVGETFSVEVEVKVSKSDLRREFTSKTTKHWLYANCDDHAVQSSPTYWYLYVPPHLADEANALAEQHFPKAGVAVYDPDSKALPGRRTSIRRKAQKLHERPPTERMRRTVLLRMGSELVGRYIAEAAYQDALREALERLGKDVIAAVKAATTAADPEETT